MRDLISFLALICLVCVAVVSIYFGILKNKTKDIGNTSINRMIQIKNSIP